MSWYVKERQKLYNQAKLEGRLCVRCGWMVTKHRWVKGKKNLCISCEDALKGVNVSSPYGKFQDEPIDKTGEDE